MKIVKDGKKAATVVKSVKKNYSQRRWLIRALGKMAIKEQGYVEFVKLDTCKKCYRRNHAFM